MGKSYQPPFQINAETVKLSIKIAELIGRWDGNARPKPKPKLRKENKILTIQSSLAIEGNTLSLDQVSAILDQKRVIGPKKDIIEVQNAIEAYESLAKLNPESEKDFLRLHGILMENLVDRSGKYRQGQVGVLKGSKVSHVAPPAKQVPLLMQQLFEWIKSSDHDALIVSCVAHYEIEFIHPFLDGNGRIGRLWQSLILQKKYPIFEFVPIESVIRKNQKKYYESLEKSDRYGDSTTFLNFMMHSILQALEEVVYSKNFETSTIADRAEVARQHFQSKEFSRSDYIKIVGNISTATASRDLQLLKEGGKIQVQGDKRTAKYVFKT